MNKFITYRFWILRMYKAAGNLRAFGEFRPRLRGGVMSKISCKKARKANKIMVYRQKNFKQQQQTRVSFEEYELEKRTHSLIQVKLDKSTERGFCAF